MVIATQKPNCKASSKSPHFFILITPKPWFYDYVYDYKFVIIWTIMEYTLLHNYVVN
jgi:hypothetical protein